MTTVSTFVGFFFVKYLSLLIGYGNSLSLINFLFLYDTKPRGILLNIIITTINNNISNSTQICIILSILNLV